jgi:(p)ppGpp synthase/HD superfamily hydrolase
MIYSETLQKAIDFAIKVHQLDQNQTRKGKRVPYITHPLAIGIILARAGAEEDIIIAGILHDTIEDSIESAKITKDIIEKEFGKTVARMVNDVTEQDKSLPWPIRKQIALEHITKMQKDSLLVKSADVLHNMRDMLKDYKIEGNEMFQRFNQKATKEMQLDRYRRLVEAFKNAWKDNPLLLEIKNTYDEIEKLWS